MNHVPLVDSYGRHINYLRISLTEACNFRCVYCVPKEGLPAQVKPSGFLTPDQIARFARIISGLGVYRVRLTGGEPLLRTDILEIVRKIKDVPGITDLSITTNGSKLVPLVHSLKAAGLDRVNISFDSVDPERFKKITLSNAYAEVLGAVHAAVRAGFPVKLNMVILNGVTPGEIIRFVELAVKFPLEVRFLEFMPLCGSGWSNDLFYPIEKVREIVRENFKLGQVEARGSEVAQSFPLEGGCGKVGFIASLTESFCEQCSRMRLSADGQIYPCLFSDTRVSVAELLRREASDEAVIEAIRHAARIKPAGNQFKERPFEKDTGRAVEVHETPLIHHIGG
ncbi:MAG: GTP 3',8-cyclase MoaA [Candidatus Omnitrophota bacterium]|nr:GTP 3',8-cyclase MoaA [Candidatus Omnitrophota bacterium]